MAKKAAVNPFDALAVNAPVTAAKGKATHPVAEVDDEVMQAVEDVVSIKAKIKVLEQELVTAEEIIIEAVRPQHDDLARSGKFTKSMSVNGYDAIITYVTSDKFSALKDPVIIDHVKDLLKKRFDEFFEKARTISMKKAIVEDQAKITALVNAFTKANLTLGDYFDVEDVLKAVKGLDEKQFELSVKDLAEFRTLVKQAKPALK